MSWTQVMPPEVDGAREPTSQDRYLRTRQRMTAEVNAAVEGALAGGADEVIVNDSHDGMRNLIPEELHPAVRFITGNDKPLGMAQGVDLEGVGAVFYTGYHAKAGTPAAPLAHTWTGWLNDVRIDGVSTGEFGINAAVAGSYGVPVVLVTGDDKAVAQTQAFLGDQVVGAVVKEGISTFSALHLHPLKAQQVIREAAEQAVGRARDAPPFTLETGGAVELTFDHQARADQAVLVPGVVRTGERSIAWIPQNGDTFIQTFRAVMMCAGIRMSP
ncbi:MAG: M55 family metallopeptidase [Thermomicrobiales bacterium]